MPHDPARLADTRAWLDRARADRRAAEHGLTAEPPLTADVLFHCQQSVEKCFKALLAWHDVPFRKTHSLEELGERCLSVDESLRALVDRVVPLTEYAWKFRYPGEYDEPALEEAAESRRLAEQVWDAVVARLPQEAWPSAKANRTGT
jgi:HEPN domain-containing protein